MVLGLGSISGPTLLILTIAGSGPPADARLLAAGIGAAVAVLIEWSVTHRRGRRARGLRQAALSSSIPAIAFACGASISVTLAGALAGVVGVGGITILRNCWHHQLT